MKIENLKLPRRPDLTPDPSHLAPILRRAKPFAANHASVKALGFRKHYTNACNWCYAKFHPHHRKQVEISDELGDAGQRQKAGLDSHAA